LLEKAVAYSQVQDRVFDYRQYLMRTGQQVIAAFGVDHALIS